MEDNRKPWIRPQLIVLGRGTPEENVLQACKTSKIGGPSTTKTMCKKKLGQACKSQVQHGFCDVLGLFSVSLSGQTCSCRLHLRFRK